MKRYAVAVTLMVSLISAGCGDRASNKTNSPLAQVPKEVAQPEQAKSKLPLEFEVYKCDPSDEVGEDFYCILLLNQQLEQITVSCSITKPDGNQNGPFKITVPGNGRYEFVANPDFVINRNFDLLLYQGDSVTISSRFHDEKLHVAIPGIRKPRPKVPISFKVADTFYLKSQDNNPREIGCSVIVENRSFNDIEINWKVLRPNGPVAIESNASLGRQSAETLSGSGKDHETSICEGDKIVVSSKRFLPVEYKVRGLAAPKPNLAGNPNHKDVPGQLRRNENNQIVLPEPGAGVADRLTEYGMPIGIDRYGMPNEKVQVREADSVTDPGAKRLMADPREFFHMRSEYRRLRGIAARIKQRGGDLKENMDDIDYQRWLNLSGDRFKNKNGFSIFEGG